MSEQDLSTEVNPLEMSDADIMEMDIFAEGLAPSLTDDEGKQEVSEDQTDIVPEDITQDEGEEYESDPSGEVEAEETFEEAGSTEESDESETDEETDADEEDEGEEDSPESDDSDYKAQVEKILAPFKANGKEIQVDSVDDAVTLMKMGANYNKKMAALKPNLKIMRMLENQGLLDEAKLNYLIDLDKHKPEAISKLVKESGLDPLNMEVDEASDYEPESYQVDDRELALDEVLKDIQDSDTYAETVDLISDKWDQSSRDVIVNNPEVIRVINDHKQNGIFDQITTVIEQDRMLGKLSGLSDIEAYKQVGDRLHAAGKFGSTEPNTDEANETVKPPANKPKANPQLKNRKKAASSSRAKPAKKAITDFNPLEMSDEEFEKIASSQYM